MAVSDAQRRAIAKYNAAHPEVMRKARAKYEEKRGKRKRDRAAYMREYRRRKALEARSGDV